MAPSVRSKLRTLGRAVRTGWLVLGIALGLGLAVEGGARLVVRCVDGDPAPDPRASADAYGGATWPAAYYEEFRRTKRLRWEPYVYWRRLSCSGPEIQVDERGLRRTWNPDAAAVGSEGIRRVFAFGGSTMWGTGARTDATIPSLLSKGLAAGAARAPCRVTNFGETGWVSGQELIALELELRRGEVPAVVVFYDGINDTVSGPINGRGGLPQNEVNRETEFTILIEGPRLRREAGRQLARGSGIYRLAKLLGGAEVPPPIQGGAALADEVARAYHANIAHVNRLARAYGFAALFYWQPSLHRKKNLTPYERAVLEREARWWPFFELVHERVVALAGAEPGFHDVSGLFADEPSPRFVDQWHLGEAGNEVVARRILEDLGPLLAR